MIKIATKFIISKYLKNKFLNGNEITEKDLLPILREIRIALLNSDVNIDVIKDFFQEIKDELLIHKNYSPSDSLDVVIFTTIRRKLIDLLGKKNDGIILDSDRLNRILVVGLNGSGKTTTTAKLSYFLKNKQNASVKNISLDIYRPGAFDQLKKLSDAAGIPCFETKGDDFKETIKKHIVSAQDEGHNCILFDNYGLLPDNTALLDEIERIKKLVNPTEVLFVVDAMSGQEILSTVKAFHERLNITGLIISKTDSNAPMGGAFSISYLLKLPIKFMGKGENLEDLIIFYPERIANLILGEGDILSLAETMKNTSTDQTQKFFSKIMNGNFDLEDLVSQIREVKKIGNLKGIFKFLPGNFSSKVSNLEGAEHQLRIWETLISSMTVKERRNPRLFKKQPNRRARVIRGSGRKPDELNQLLKKWEESKKKLGDLVLSFKRGKNPMSFFIKN